MHSVARNHALVDGNTRLAWAATRVFCLLNGRDLDYAVDEAEASFWPWLAASSRWRQSPSRSTSISSEESWRDQTAFERVTLNAR